LLCVSELALGTGTGAVVPAPAAMNPTLPAGPRIAPPIAAAVPSPTMPLSRPSGPSASLCLLLPVRGCAASPWGSLESPIPAGAGPHSWIDLTPTPIPPAYPDARAFPSEAWDGGTNSVLLFGGLGISQGNFTLEQDTWSFSAGNWTELIAAGACFPTTCPSPRSDAMMTYDAADNEMVLFGGENFTGPTTVAFGDTWVFAGGTWTNITASAGAAPSPRFDAAMTFDSADGYVLLFGGASANGTALGDTWSFQGGTWTNRSTDYSVAPDWRSAASIADDPGGGVLMFGGEANGTILEDNCYAGGPWDAWWYINGTWSAAYKNFTCINSPFGVFSVDSNQAPPCGRIYAGLAWSPKNHRFVLFGGLGPSPTNGTLCGYGASPVVQNDTWLYIGPTGGQESAWVEDNTPGAPSARDAFGAAPDFADGYVLVFGGVAGFLALTNETWRYYAVVQATLGGPLNLTAGAANPPPFLLKGFGGSGDLGYAFNISLLKTTHPLTGPGCAHFSSSAGATVPPTAVVTLDCIPDTTAYNIFAVHVQVWDLQAPTHRAFANWTFTVNPVEKLLLYSQFSGIFYPGFSLTNALGIYAFIAGSAVTKVSASIQGQPVGFAPSGSSPYWWNASVGMGTYGPGAALQVTVSISDWSESATLPFHYAYMPDWLVELASLGGAVQGTTITTSPVQTWNNSYLLSQSVQLPLAKLAKFFLNTVPLVGGNYTLLPTLSMTFSESSSGTVSVGGAVQVNSPSIGIGPFN
ncbi:MAG TPA: kelch repeat-containing protein, partial [Thermoplasmata archaeon]|nr:kelch repeat-containing protein [Thermoplasmata archaeon]